MQFEIIPKLFEILNEVKNFTPGYSTKNMDRGYMLIEYKGKRYAVKFAEITNPSERAVDDIETTQFYL